MAGVPALPGGANPDVAILVDRSEVRTQVLNFAMRVTETVDIAGTPTEVTYWKLASGQAHDAQGATIPYPTLAEVLAQDPADPDQSWDVMAGTTIDFLERYFEGNGTVHDFRLDRRPVKGVHRRYMSVNGGWPHCLRLKECCTLRKFWQDRSWHLADKSVWSGEVRFRRGTRPNQIGLRRPSLTPRPTSRAWRLGQG